jgi:xylose isomerase
MRIKHAVMLGTVGRYADRFHEFQPSRPLEARLDAVRRIPGVNGIEPVYPQDFEDVSRTVTLLKARRLPVSAVNVNIKTEPKWRRGSLTAPDAAVRREAVRYITAGMDLAAELGATMITVCPLMDGWDYPFQVDYQRQWEWTLDGFRAAAAHRTDIRVSIEYKPFESRNHSTISHIGQTLHLCAEAGAANLGITMDVGHALAARETPAASACLAARAGRLFYVHFNDNDRNWDWDMLPGSAALWETVETLFYLRRLGWDGWFSYDVFTRHGDPAEGIAATIQIINDLDAFIDKVGPETIETMIAEGTPAQALPTLVRAMVDPIRAGTKS